MKATYICFIYAIHIFIIYWFVKRFLEKSRNSIVNIMMILLIVFDWCIQHVQCVQNGAFIVHRACVVHKQAITANHLRAWKDYLRVEKDYLRLEKTIYGLKDYLRLEKDYLRLWPSFCRIVSLCLITWHTFNQSIDKNIWMLYIIAHIFYHVHINKIIINIIKIDNKWNFHKAYKLHACTFVSSVNYFGVNITYYLFKNTLLYDEKQFCHPQSHFKYPVIFYKKPHMKPTVSGYLQKFYDQTLEMTKSTETCSTFHISLTLWLSRDSPTPISC